MRRNRVTIKDIALEARVTAQTVSRVFRNQGYISKKTKAAVLAAELRTQQCGDFPSDGKDEKYRCGIRLLG